MKLLLCLALLGAGTTACEGQPPATTSPTLPKTSASRPMSPPAATPYVVRGILDPGLNNLVAFALKIPHGWQLM